MAQASWLTSTLISALALFSTSGFAETSCYRANGDSGELNFRGLADGAPFSGFFEDFDVTVCLQALDLTTAEIEVRVHTGSATVGNRQGDEALRGDELFAPERFPEAVWRLAGVTASDPGFEARGELRLRDVTGKQAVHLQLEQADKDVWLSGHAEIQRLDYNVGLGEFADTEFIRNRVDVRFELRLEPDEDP